MEVRFLDKALEDFISNLEKSTIAKVLRTIDLLESFGNQLGMPHSKKVGAKLFELRVRGKQEIRILYVFYENNVVLLHGFVKKTQKITKNELSVALQKLKTLDTI